MSDFIEAVERMRQDDEVLVRYAANDPVERYLATLTTQASRNTMAWSLVAVAKLLGAVNEYAEADPRLLPWQHAHEIAFTARALLVEHYGSHRSVNKALSAVRGVARQARVLRLIDREQLLDVMEVRYVKGDSPPAGRHLSKAEINRLMIACGEDPIGIRNRAMLMVFRTGVRVSELLGLLYKDVTTEMVIHGKGHKKRILHVPRELTHYLNDWRAVRGNEPGPFFCKVYRSVVKPEAPLTPAAVNYTVKSLCKKARVRDFGTHSMRRTAVGDMLDAGVDLVTVSKVVGHSSPSTTARYDVRHHRRQADALDKLFD